MTEYELAFATRQLKRTFERAIGRSVTKILTELITNADDSYKRLSGDPHLATAGRELADPAPILILFERRKKKFSVVDNAEGLTDNEMRERFVTYGQESSDRARGLRTRSLFGKGLRDVLFTQHNGQVKSIKDGMFYNCRFKWKSAGGHERPVVDIRPASRVTAELREALVIPEDGTLVEFVLRQDVPNPQPDKLVDALSRFYMLRMINSSPHREVILRVVGPGARLRSERPISYRFPELEVKDQFHETIVTDLGTHLTLEALIGLGPHEMSQGEVGYADREGGLLVLDEDDAVLDLNLFGFDDDPAARRIAGTVKLRGAGQYIRTKLNQPNPEEVLTETRDGFDKQHRLFRSLRERLYPRLSPIASKLRELGPTPTMTLSEKTRERHQQALDILNRLASEMLGNTARVPVVPTSRRVPPPEGIAFVNAHISVQTGLVTPAALLVNSTLVDPADVIDVASDCAEINVSPRSLTIGNDVPEAGVAVKIVRIESMIADVSGKIIAQWKTTRAVLDVTTTVREVLTPVNGIEFDRDEYNVRVNAERRLRLYVDLTRIPLDSTIVVVSDDPAVRVLDSPVRVSSVNQVTSTVAQVNVRVTGTAVRRLVVVTAAHGEYVSGARVSVVKREKPERGKQGLFKDYRFQPLERKVQTQFVPEGYILVNTKDPVNARYFGDDPGAALEANAHCQLRLADLVLNECLQIMVSQALDSGRLERRFPDNPEIDVRNYVDEKKFEIGPDVHTRFVTQA